MSGRTPQGNRPYAGKPDGRMKHTNDGSRMVWKPKTKAATDETLSSASSCQKDNSSHTGESLVPIVKDVESFELMSNSCQKSDSGSKHPGSLSTSDCSLKDSITFSSQLDPVESSSVACLKDSSMKKVDSSGGPEDVDRGSSIIGFDICPKRVNSGVKLNASLYAKNKERRNQLKRSVEGRNIDMLRPGMVLLKGYVSCDEQISIVKTCRGLGNGDGGFYQPGYRVGAKLHLKMMCLGKNWDPESSKYSDTRPIDNSKPPGIPDKFHDMVKKAIQDSNEYIQKTVAKVDAEKLIPFMSPDICIVNFYNESGKLGLHQDKDESIESRNRGLPVVSFSIGESAEFVYGDSRDMENAHKVVLESGDVLIFGGKSRDIFHGVTRILPDTAPASLLEATDMSPGRLNLTFRKY